MIGSPKANPIELPTAIARMIQISRFRSSARCVRQRHRRRLRASAWSRRSHWGSRAARRALSRALTLDAARATPGSKSRAGEPAAAVSASGLGLGAPGSAGGGGATAGGGAASAVAPVRPAFCRRRGAGGVASARWGRDVQLASVGDVGRCLAELADALAHDWATSGSFPGPGRRRSAMMRNRISSPGADVERQHAAATVAQGLRGPAFGRPPRGNALRDRRKPPSRRHSRRRLEAPIRPDAHGGHRRAPPLAACEIPRERRFTTSPPRVARRPVAPSRGRTRAHRFGRAGPGCPRRVPGTRAPGRSRPRRAQLRRRGGPDDETRGPTRAPSRKRSGRRAHQSGSSGAA